MKSKLWLVFALITTISWGVWGAFTGLPTENGFPETLVYCVWALTMIPPALIALKLINWKLETDKKSIFYGCIIGLLGAGGQMVLFHAVTVGPTYLIFPIISLSPMITILLSYFFLKERTGKLGAFGILLALISLPLFNYTVDGGDGSFGILWFVLAMVVLLAWGLQAYFMKFANEIMRAESIFFYMTVTGLAIIPIALMMTDFSQPINYGTDGPWLAAAIQVLNSIGALFLVYAFRYGKAMVVSPLTNAGAPLITAVIAMIILGFVPGVYAIIGISLAVVAAFLLALDPGDPDSPKIDIPTNKTIHTGLLILGLFTLMGCNGQSDDTETPPKEDTTRATVTYMESNADFANPDRGFYRYSETHASSYTLLDEATLKAYREPNTSPSANYQTINTLVFRYFVLDNFTNSPISNQFLDDMQKDFDVARRAGIKLIPRFTYTTTVNSGNCPEGFICPPYGDAPKEIVLQHIAQIGPVLTQNSDVVSALQMGLIGTWGENYYTDYFGDASVNGDQGKLIDKNWQDRIDVLKALLDNTPEEMMVQVRYPQMKQRAVYGIDANTKVAALTAAKAFKGNQKSRIGFHNDCLFASPDDFGTYADYGNSSTPAQTDIANLKSYFEADAKYVMVGGETCFDGYSPQNDCALGGMADTDLEALHYTYLNADYNNEVNNDWVDGGCMDAIKKRLGYRLILREGDFPNFAKAGSSVKIDLKIENVGFAAPMHAKNILLVMRNKTSGLETILPLDVDIRSWAPAKVNTLDLDVTVPQDIAPGDYDLYLKLEDTHSTLKDRVAYCIRFSNEGIWDGTKGYNKLNHMLLVK